LVSFLCTSGEISSEVRTRARGSGETLPRPQLGTRRGGSTEGRRRVKEEDEQCKKGDSLSDLDLIAKQIRVWRRKKIPGCVGMVQCKW
jgi:hypothetical protein